MLCKVLEMWPKLTTDWRVSFNSCDWVIGWCLPQGASTCRQWKLACCFSYCIQNQSPNTHWPRGPLPIQRSQVKNGLCMHHTCQRHIPRFWWRFPAACWRSTAWAVSRGQSCSPQHLPPPTATGSVKTTQLLGQHVMFWWCWHQWRGGGQYGKRVQISQVRQHQDRDMTAFLMPSQPWLYQGRTHFVRTQ